MLESPRAGWKQFSLPRPLAYGGSVSHERGLLLIGGGDAEENLSACHWIRWSGGDIELQPAPALPIPLANCGAALVGDTAYVVGGQQSPGATAAERGLFSLDLKRTTAAWKPEPLLPGPGRILPSVAASGGHLYVAGGADLLADAKGSAVRRYLQDAWRFTPGSGWSQLPPMPEPSCAAPAFGLNHRFFVAGGSDGILAPREAELRERHPGFSRMMKIYEPSRGQWRIGNPLSFALVTTTAALWGDLAVIPGGEDRPAHRSAAVYALEAK